MKRLLQTISNSLRSEGDSGPVMPTNLFVESEHISRDIPLGVHQLTDRRGWGMYTRELSKRFVKSCLQIKFGAAVIYSKIISKEELLKSGGQFNLGCLMTILSMKHAESTELRKLKASNLPKGSIPISEWDERGELANASKILMKVLWASRLARPDVIDWIGDLTRRVTKWSRAGDRRLHRLMCYLWETKSCLRGRTAD